MCRLTDIPNLSFNSTSAKTSVSPYARKIYPLSETDGVVYDIAVGLYDLYLSPTWILVERIQVTDPFHQHLIPPAGMKTNMADL